MKTYSPIIILGIAAALGGAPVAGGQTSQSDAARPTPNSQNPIPNAEHRTPPAPTTTAITLPNNALLPCTLSFQTWNGLLTVDVVVGKAGLQRFAIDPGLDACTLKPQSVQLVTTTQAAGQTRVTIYDRTHSVAQTQIPQIQINSLKLDNVSVGVIDVLAEMSSIAARRPDAPIGWLGSSFLSAFQVTFDYDGHYLVLDRPNAKLPKDKGAISVPIEVKDGRVIVKLSVPGARAFPALFSTSAPITVIPTQVAQQAKLKALEMLPITQPGGKTGKVGRVVLPKLGIGHALLENVNAVYVAPDAPKELNRELAIVGADLLKHYKVTLSYTRHLMILTPPAPPEDATKVKSDETDAAKVPPKGRHQKD